MRTSTQNLSNLMLTLANLNHLFSVMSGVQVGGTTMADFRGPDHLGVSITNGEPDEIILETYNALLADDWPDVEYAFTKQNFLEAVVNPAGDGYTLLMCTEDGTEVFVRFFCVMFINPLSR